MQSILTAASVVLPLFLMLSLGFGVKRARLVDDGALRQMNNLCFRVFLPILLFYNIYKTDIKSSFDGKLLLFAVGSVLASFLLTFLLIPRIEPENPRRGVLIQGIFRSNFIIFGLPVTISLYGAEKAGAASILISVIVPMYNVLSVFALEFFRSGKVQPKKLLRDVATNPLILGSAAGLLVLLSGIRFPEILDRTLSELSAIATPFALVILGASFHFDAVRGNKRQLILGLGGRLLVLPCMFLPLGVLCGFRGVELAALVAMFCSPTAVSSFTMAQQMGGDSELAGQLVVFGSAFSLVSLFGFIFVLKQLSLL